MQCNYISQTILKAAGTKASGRNPGIESPRHVCTSRHFHDANTLSQIPSTYAGYHAAIAQSTMLLK